MSPTTVASAGGRLGRYEILGALGTGGMGEVYRARDPALERDVALKLLPAETADREHLARFSREAKTLASLSHPNIVGIYSVEEAEGLNFLTMELVEGKTLAELMPRRGLRLDRFFELAIPLADAISAAHERGVIHRDLKPGNVMVDGEGRVKVLDFGLARPTARRDVPLPEGEEPTASFTGEGVLVGTVPYMSPEQLQGRTVDARSDLFSLGVVFYEMLTGSRPFAGSSTPELISAILRDTPPPVTELRPELPRHLSRIVRRCLEKEPRRRYQAARDVVNELTGLREELVSDEPARSGSGATVARRPRSRTLLLSAAAAVVAALAVGLPLANRERPPAPGPTPVVAVLPLANASGDPANDHLGIGFADSLITRLSVVPALTVVSRAAVGELPATAGTPERIARDLGASYLVDGSFQRSGQKLLVSVTLVEAAGSVVRGSWQYEDELVNLFDLQRRLAVGVSEALELTLSDSQRQRLESAPSTDLQAYTEYSRARALLQRPDVSANVQTAIDLLSRAVQRDPKFALGHAALGAAYWSRYQETLEPLWAERAQAAIQRAAQLDPDDPQVRISLAKVYRGTGRLQEAQAQLQTAVEQRPDSDDAWRELGEVLGQMGEFVAAREAIDRAIAIRPVYWENHYRSGGLGLQTGEYLQAAAAYQRAAELTPDNVRVLQNLGAAWQYAGDDSRALESFSRAIAIDPNLDAAHANVGRIHYKAGRYVEAAAAYERALKGNRRNPLVHRNLGDIYLRLGRDAEARASYLAGVTAAEELLRVNPRDAAMLALQGVCEAKLGRHDEAAAHIRSALESSPADSTVQFRAAVTYALAGRSDEALTALEAALDLGFSPDAARADDDLAGLRRLPAFAQLLRDRS